MGVPALSDESPSLVKWFWSQLFEESLFLACYFHDIGYPWQFMNGIAKQLISHGPNRPPFTMGASEIYRSYSKRLVLFPLNGYSPVLNTQPSIWSDLVKVTLGRALADTHGMPGALAFLYLNDLLREYPEAPDNGACDRFCLEWASMAIMMHDMQKIYQGDAALGDPPENPHLRTSIERDPLSFVLTLVDQIQDFGRDNASFGLPVGMDVSFHCDAACTAVDVSLRPDNILDIAYHFADVGAFLTDQQHDCKPKTYSQYFRPDTGFIDLSGLAIGGVELRPIDPRTSP